MEKKSKKEDEAQGAKSLKVLTETQFREMVDRDLKTAWHFLNAINTDEPTKKALNEFLYGRYLNQLHKAELDQQLKVAE